VENGQLVVVTFAGAEAAVVDALDAEARLEESAVMARGALVFSLRTDFVDDDEEAHARVWSALYDPKETKAGGAWRSASSLASRVAYHFANVLMPGLLGSNTRRRNRLRNMYRASLGLRSVSVWRPLPEPAYIISAASSVMQPSLPPTLPHAAFLGPIVNDNGRMTSSVSIEKDLSRWIKKVRRNAGRLVVVVRDNDASQSVVRHAWAALRSKDEVWSKLSKGALTRPHVIIVEQGVSGDTPSTSTTSAAKRTEEPMLHIARPRVPPAELFDWYIDLAKRVGDAGVFLSLCGKLGGDAVEVVAALLQARPVICLTPLSTSTTPWFLPPLFAPRPLLDISAVPRRSTADAVVRSGAGIAVRATKAGVTAAVVRSFGPELRAGAAAVAARLKKETPGAKRAAAFLVEKVMVKAAEVEACRAAMGKPTGPRTEDEELGEKYDYMVPRPCS